MLKKILLLFVIIILAVIGFIVTRTSPTVQKYQEKLAQKEPIKTSEETQYLVFFIPIEGVYEASSREAAFNDIDKKVKDIIDRIGVTGSSTHHRLAFALIIPPWIVDKAYPGRMQTAIEEAFRVAKSRNVAVYFSIMTHYLWSTRPDLWNFFDANAPGFNQKNIDNVEWTDWDKTPLLANDGKSYRYVDWGIPERLPPHMCYNSPAIQADILRFSKDIGAAVSKEAAKLKEEGKADLFAGMTVGDEPSLDDYSALEESSPLQNLLNLMKEDGTPRKMLGFCALTNKGFSRDNPPKDLRLELAKINQEFIAFWAKNLNEAGVPKNSLYTHIAAGADEVGSPVIKFTNAPIWVAFNEYSRPGWTTYPDGPLKNGFQVLYDELAKRGNPHWGGTESGPFSLSRKKNPPYEYLGWHFNHGATVVVMNTGASGSLSSWLEQGVWGNEAIAAYRKFLLE